MCCKNFARDVPPPQPCYTVHCYSGNVPDVTPVTPRCGLDASSRCACECTSPFVMPQSIIYLSISAPHSTWQAVNGGRRGQAHNPHGRISHGASSLHVLESLESWFSDHSTYSGPGLAKKQGKKKQSAKPRVLNIKKDWVSAAVASFIIAVCMSRSVTELPCHHCTLMSIFFFFKALSQKHQQVDFQWEQLGCI